MAYFSAFFFFGGPLLKRGDRNGAAAFRAELGFFPSTFVSAHEQEEATAHGFIIRSVEGAIADGAFSRGLEKHTLAQRESLCFTGTGACAGVVHGPYFSPLDESSQR